jgi:hypothetical protein
MLLPKTVLEKPRYYLLRHGSRYVCARSAFSSQKKVFSEISVSFSAVKLAA